MALDPSIILQGGAFKGPDYATTLAQVGQIKAQQDAAELQKVQLSRLSRQDQQDAASLALRKQAGGMAGKGDFAGGEQAALEGGDIDVYKAIKGLEDDHRTLIKNKLAAAAPIAFQAAQVPYDQRRQLIAAATPALTNAGWSPEEIEAFDPTDQNINGLVSSVQSLGDALKQHDDNRKFAMETDKFGYQKQNDAANRGVTVRGQNISAATARRGQDLAHSDANAAPLLTPEAIESQAQAIASGGDLPALGVGKTGALLKAKILNRAAEIQKANGNTGADMVLVKEARKANSAALRQLAQRNGVMSAAKNTAVANGSLLVDAAGKGAGTTGAPVLNRWQQAYRSGVKGSPEVAQFGLAINTFANEYAKVVSGATGAAGVAEGARQEMLKHLSEASTPEQVAAIVQQAKKEMASSTNALQSQIGETRKAIQTGGQRAPSPKPSGHPSDITALLKKYGN